MSAKDGLPEKTLFGTNFDSNKLLTKIDYTDFYNGKWNERQNYKEGLKHGKILKDPDYENAKRSLAKQKVRFNDAQQILRDAQNSALSFRNNPVYSNPQTNQIQVEDYNSMRKTKSSLAFENRRKPTEVYSSLNNYKMNGDIFNSPRGLNYTQPAQTSLVSPRFDQEPNLTFVENYVAADGTQYKIYNAPSGHTVKEVNCPTRNIIHVPGKYHEHYRSTVVESEMPQNIKHKFRARLGGDHANELLKDQLKVHDTISKIQNSGIIKKNDKTDDVMNANNIEFKMEKKLSDYYDLGNHLRHAISHGYPSVYKVSYKEEVHNNNVSKEYLSEWDLNVKSPWRRRKDWIGKWTDKDIVDRRNAKGLAAIQMEKAKAAAPA